MKYKTELRDTTKRGHNTSLTKGAFGKVNRLAGVKLDLKVRRRSDIAKATKVFENKYGEYLTPSLNQEIEGIK